MVTTSTEIASQWVDCENCGKQNLVDGTLEERCLFCNLPLRKKAPAESSAPRPIKKEAIMQEGKGTAPPRPKKRKEHRPYFEKNKEAILADYLAMTLRKFFAKWGIATTTWQKLKIRWDVKSKRKGSKKLAEKKPTAETKDTPANIEGVAKTEHERYLVLLGYQQAVREFLKAGQI